MRKKRIMHGLSEVAGQNSYSVQGLREIGENAETVVYSKHPFAYKYDKCLDIDKSRRALFPLFAIKLFAFYIKALFVYDVFHFHFGRSILNNAELWTYKVFGKDLYFEFHGSDLRDQKKFCEVTGIPFSEKEASCPKLHKRNEKICQRADGIIIHDDELIPYLPPVRNSIYVVPLRVDIGQFTPCFPKEGNEHIRIVHAPSKRAAKGTAFVLEAYEQLKRKYDNIELVLVEGKTQQEAFEIYKTADIIVDQLYAGTYGVFAIESMALGKPVITYISDEMKERLPEELPIISGGTKSIVNALELLINDPKLRITKGIQGRKYVENYHDYRVIAHVLKDIYYKKAKPLSGREAFEQVRAIKEQSGMRKDA